MRVQSSLTNMAVGSPISRSPSSSCRDIHQPRGARCTGRSNGKRCTSFNCRIYERINIGDYLLWMAVLAVILLRGKGEASQPTPS